MTAPLIDLHFHVESDGNYVLDEPLTYHSPRYRKTIIIPIGFKSDGASGPATDIVSEAWWVHDYAWRGGTWEDGTPITLWQSTMLLRDILAREGRWVRAVTWPVATWARGALFGR